MKKIRACLNFAAEDIFHSGRWVFSPDEGGAGVPAASEQGEKSTGSELKRPRAVNSKQALSSIVLTMAVGLCAAHGIAYGIGYSSSRAAASREATSEAAFEETRDGTSDGVRKGVPDETLKRVRPKKMSGNPIFPGWYADPHAAIYGDTYWVFPTYSALYSEQTFMDCFSSKDLVKWKKHERIIDTDAVAWADSCMWAPAHIAKEGKYYLFFGANDAQEGHPGGIGVAVADRPQGPYKDLLGRPLVSENVNGAQPIDQFVWEENGEFLMFYGGWGHCNVVRLKPDFSGLLPFEDGSLYREVTPEGYVEGSFMLKRGGKYYFMWSEGGWGGPNYCVAYAIADSPLGPFERIGKVLEQDTSIATSAGHHSIVNIPGTDDWYIFYHRRPLGDSARDHRAICIEKLEFAPDGRIVPVKLTFEGIPARKIAKDN